MLLGSLAKWNTTRDIATSRVGWPDHPRASTLQFFNSESPSSFTIRQVLCCLYKRELFNRTAFSKCISSMFPATELLVHISAPCGASDDARYRKEAQGYLQFKPANWHPLCRLDFSAGDGINAASSPVFDVAAHVDEDKETDHGTVDLSGLQTPGRKPQRLPKIHVTRTPLDCRPQTAPPSISCIKETPVPLLHRRSRSDSREQSSSFIPDSQPAGSFANSLPKRRHRSKSPLPRLSLSSPSSKRRRFKQSGVSLVAEAPSSSPLRDRRLDWKPPVSSQSGRSILDPPPKPSNASFKTYITAPLALITAHLPLPTFYVSFQAQPPNRQLKTHERGHWSFSISSFSVAHKKKVWTYLEKFIGEGRAGRVSCFLEEMKNEIVEEAKKWPAMAQSGDNSKTHDRTLPEEREDSPGKEEFLKVYCMGEAVPSIWLLLFIATSRQIKGRRARWIDASETIVVQMK